MGNWVWGDQQAACSRWRLWASVPRGDSSGPTVSLTLDTAGSGRGASCEEKALQAQVAPGVAGQGREGAERQAQQSGLLGRQRGAVGGLSREDSVVGGLSCGRVQHRVGSAQVRLLGRAGLEAGGHRGTAGAAAGPGRGQVDERGSACLGSAPGSPHLCDNRCVQSPASCSLNIK